MAFTLLTSVDTKIHMVHKHACRQNTHINKINLFFKWGRRRGEEWYKSLMISKMFTLCIKTEWTKIFPLAWASGWLNEVLLWDMQLSEVSRGGRRLDIYQTPQSTGPWQVRNICLACSVKSPEECPQTHEHFVCHGWWCLSSLEVELQAWKPQMMGYFFLI